MKRGDLLRTTALVVLATVALLPGLFAAKPGSGSLPITVHLHDTVVDEQNTTAYYNNGTTFCSGTNNPVQPSAFTGDHVVLGPTTAYDFGSPWSTFSPLSSTSYVNNSNCGNNCLRAQFNSNSKILTLDTRGTAGPRAMRLDFSNPCAAGQCPGPGGSASVFDNGVVTTDGLLNVTLDFPYTSMEVCSSRACPEAQPAFAKFWFNDPSASDVTWRVDWVYLRVLRMTTDTWYILADSCDGSQIAGLSKLTGNRTKPKAVFNGYYKVPFFQAAVRP